MLKDCEVKLNMVLNNQKIGIIGGAGVAATNKLLELIEVKLTQNGAYRDCHHPEMIIWQATQAPSRSMFLEGKGESFIPEYISIAKSLKQLGVNKIAMCCNTAHFAIDTIEKEADIKIINLVEKCVQIAKESGAKKVGLIVSDGCLKGEVYQKYFRKIFPTAEIIYPDNEYQKMVTTGICNIKNIHRFDNIDSNESPQKIFGLVQKHLYDKGAEIIIIGCTDIRAGYYEKDNIDSLEVLTDIIIKETRG